ncbi:MAG: hypothetical protein NTW85_11450 [Methylococcales bacterium]|nr:hypothetical protein [Methylococcales bacterium]
MKPQRSELEAQVIFETFERKRKAEEILAETLTPRPLVTFIAYFVASGLTIYLIASSNIPTLVRVFAAGLIGTAFELSLLHRRLDAAVELIRLLEIERT